MTSPRRARSVPSPAVLILVLLASLASAQFDPVPVCALLVKPPSVSAPVVQHDQQRCRGHQPLRIRRRCHDRRVRPVGDDIPVDCPNPRTPRSLPSSLCLVPRPRRPVD